MSSTTLSDAGKQAVKPAPQQATQEKYPNERFTHDELNGILFRQVANHEELLGEMLLKGKFTRDELFTTLLQSLWERNAEVQPEAVRMLRNFFRDPEHKARVTEALTDIIRHRRCWGAEIEAIRVLAESRDGRRHLKQVLSEIKVDSHLFVSYARELSRIFIPAHSAKYIEPLLRTVIAKKHGTGFEVGHCLMDIGEHGIRPMIKLASHQYLNTSGYLAYAIGKHQELGAKLLIRELNNEPGENKIDLLRALSFANQQIPAAEFLLNYTVEASNRFKQNAQAFMDAKEAKQNAPVVEEKSKSFTLSGLFSRSKKEEKNQTPPQTKTEKEISDDLFAMRVGFECLDAITWPHRTGFKAGGPDVCRSDELLADVANGGMEQVMQAYKTAKEAMDLLEINPDSLRRERYNIREAVISFCANILIDEGAQTNLEKLQKLFVNGGFLERELVLDIFLHAALELECSIDQSRRYELSKMPGNKDLENGLRLLYDRGAHLDTDFAISRLKSITGLLPSIIDLQCTEEYINSKILSLADYTNEGGEKIQELAAWVLTTTRDSSLQKHALHTYMRNSKDTAEAWPVLSKILDPELGFEKEIKIEAFKLINAYFKNQEVEH